MARKLSLVSLVVILLCVVPTAAGATVRYAAPGGPVSGACTNPDPTQPNGACRIDYAVSAGLTEPNDEIVVQPGTHDISANNATIGERLDVHGEAGAARPLILDTNAGTPLTLGSGATGTTLRHLSLESGGTSSAAALRVEAPSSTVEDVRLVAKVQCAAVAGAGHRYTDVTATLTGGGSTPCLQFGGASGATLRRVTARVTGASGSGIAASIADSTTVEDSTFVTDGTAAALLINGGGVTVRRVKVEGAGLGILASTHALITDTIVTAEGPDAIAVDHIITSGDGLRLRNVTANATGPDSVGVRARMGFFGFPGGSINARNVIARGDGSDIVAQHPSDEAGSCALDPCAPGVVDLAHSNYRTLAGAGPKTQGAGNQSADPRFLTAGDFRLADGSPAIDAGANDVLGPTAYDGAARVQGAGVDIGAFERAKPNASVPPGGTPPPPPPIDSVAPTLSRVSLVSRRIRSGRALRLRLSSNEAATLRFRVLRRLKGRRRAGRCRTTAQRGRRCTKRTLVKRRTGRTAGPAAVMRVRIGRLKPGRYTLDIRAVDVAGNVSTRTRLNFTVRRAKRRT